jgi:hypothetical protein
MTTTGAKPLHERLLHARPALVDAAPERRWVYPFGGIALTSVFLLYHLCVLLVWVGPTKDLAAPFATTFLKAAKGYEYFGGTRNDQSWAMFAPNPERTNAFVKVFVIDKAGATWDFGQDIHQRDRYPYVFYDRRGKVNRNLDGKKHYQRIYGAWVCREWERLHAGESARAVRFSKWWTDVPEAEVVLEQGGWDAWSAPHKEFEQETIRCASVDHGTLPNTLRERYGLSPIADGVFREVELETWIDGPAE